MSHVPTNSVLPIHTRVYSEDATSTPRPPTTTTTSSSSKSSSAAVVVNKDALALLARSPKLQVGIVTLSY